MLRPKTYRFELIMPGVASRAAIAIGIVQLIEKMRSNVGALPGLERAVRPRRGLSGRRCLSIGA